MYRDPSSEGSVSELEGPYLDLLRRHEELVRQMGDEIGPFPDAGIDGFLSHFIMSIQFLKGEMAGHTVNLVLPPATQTVARSAPFTYEAGARQTAHVPLPAACSLAPVIAEDDFLDQPAGFFQDGKEVVWMQILNLDAQAKTPEVGPVRIILGETLKREYPDAFRPSLGVAESLGGGGFPARLFFNPYAVIETDFGAFRAVHGTLSYGRVTGFPPCGTPVSIQDCIPLDPIYDAEASESEPSEPLARLIALSHPIDVAMQVTGEEAFGVVERAIGEGFVTSR